MQFPIGIDSERFILALEDPEVQDHIKELKERFSGRKVFSISPSHALLCALYPGESVFRISKLE